MFDSAIATKVKVPLIGLQRKPHLQYPEMSDKFLHQYSTESSDYLFNLQLKARVRTKHKTIDSQGNFEQKIITYELDYKEGNNSVKRVKAALP